MICVFAGFLPPSSEELTEVYVVCGRNLERRCSTSPSVWAIETPSTSWTSWPRTGKPLDQAASASHTRLTCLCVCVSVLTWTNRRPEAAQRSTTAA